MATIELDVSNESEDAPNAKEMSEVRGWLDEVQAAEKREHNWRKEGRKVICLYEADKQVDYQFNILYSNTETLAPALYSTTPTPVVQRRFKDDDPIGLEASKVVQRTLAYSLDNGQAIYASFDDLMTHSVLSALVPGRGVTRFKYDAEIVDEAEVEDTEDPTDQNEIDSRPEKSLPGTAETEIATGKQIAWEAVCGEPIAWDRFCHGYGQTWQDVPWISYKWPMTREECIKNFGRDVGMKVLMSSVSDKELDEDRNPSEDAMKGMKVAWVYEIWNKATKEVIFISEGYPDAPLKKVPDPLGLTGFFNCPKPLTFFQRVSSLLPQTLYAFYSEQAKELNQVTARIGRLTKALKVRGIYDGSIDALGRIFQEDDNALIAADNTAAMYDRGGIEKAIWMLPIDKIIQVLQQLYVNRQQTKQVIYEITGLSDILRGTSNPNETLGAQKIKDQWGNLRLRKLQKRVQTYVVDSLRIMAEIACTKLGPDTLKQITNLKYPSMQEKQAAQMMLQQQSMMAQQTGQPPAEPPPEILDMLSKPSWEEISQILQNDLQRSYRIDIETNSTIEPEATEDKESMMGLMNALSQFLLGVQPLVADGSLPFDAMRAIMLTISRRFNFGDQVEDELKKMKAPQPKPQEPPPEMIQAQKQIEQDGQQLQADQQKFAQDKMNFSLSMQEQEGQLKLKKLMDDMQVKMAAKQAQMEIEMAQQEAQMELKLEQREADLEIKMAGKSEALNLQHVAETQSLQIQHKGQQIENTHALNVEKFKQEAKGLAGNEADDVMGGKGISDLVDGRTATLVETLQEAQKESQQALTALAEAVKTLKEDQNAPRSITDSKGRTYTIRKGV